MFGVARTKHGQKCTNGGYSGKKFADAVKGAIGAEVTVAKRNEQQKFAVIPKRWVV